jgi:hypothetical protein
MRKVFFGTCPKDPAAPDNNEDQLAFDSVRGRLALCDGASESYDSRLWAHVLAQRFIVDSAVTKEWVAAAVATYVDCYDFDALSWSQQAAYQRGSFATLLGIEYDRVHNAIEILAVGDSLAILVDGETIIQSWPFTDPERFKDRPTLLSTLTDANAFVGESGFWTRAGKTFHLDELSNPLLLCMTDALGEWALRQVITGDNGLSRLLSIMSEEELEALVIEERTAKRMRIDDTTLLVLTFSQDEGLHDLSLT